MRVLRLRVDGRRIVDLHPALSVVHGLDAAQAARLRRGVAAVTCGLAPEGDGLLEAHGLLLDASQDDVDLLDLGADPADAVVVHATLRDGPPEASDDPESTGLARLRTAERDVLLLATDRRWGARALAVSRAAVDPAVEDLARAEQLRLAVALHEGTDVEPLRRALDADRDDCRNADDSPAGAGGVGEIVDELAALGVDLRSHDIDDDEVRRVADDLLDEHHRHAAWVVGARVELEGVEQRLLTALPHGGRAGHGVHGTTSFPESGERRAERATVALAAALDRADELREAAAPGALSAQDLEWALLRRLGDRRRDHPAGTAPVVLDRVLAPLSDEEVEHLLERIEPLSRGVQVIVLDDHPAALAWARRVGQGRAAAVHATPARPVERSPTMPPEPRQPPR